MTCVLKYSGADRDYFLSTTTKTLRPYEYIVKSFECKTMKEANAKKLELYKTFAELGLIVDTSNITHLRTTNRDAFRIHLLNEYNVDMFNVERKMNEKYMEIESDSDSEDEMPTGPLTRQINSSSSSVLKLLARDK